MHQYYNFFIIIYSIIVIIIIIIVIILIINIIISFIVNLIFQGIFLISSREAQMYLKLMKRMVSYPFEIHVSRHILKNRRDQRPDLMRST